MKDKILLISCTGLGTGGVQSVIMQIVRNLSDKYQFDVVIFTEEIGAYQNEFLSYGGKIFRISDYTGSKIRRKVGFYLRGIKIKKEIFRILTQEGPYKAIHCNNYYESAFCLEAAKKAGVKNRICHAHGYYGDMDTFIRRIYLEYCRNKIKKFATLCVGCSTSAGKMLFGHDNAMVLPNAVDLRRFDVNLRNKYQKNLNPRLIQVGYYSGNKNQLFTINVFKSITQEYPGASLWLIGFGDFKHRLEQEVNQLGLGSNVSFFPGSSDIPDLLAQSDVFMFPSINEGFGMAAIEAQAMGLHCFASCNVPREIDIGACTFLNVNDGVDNWKSSIIDWWANHKNIDSVDYARYDLSRIINRYDCMYST